MDSGSIGKKLRELRLKKNKTQAEVAKSCGISPQALNNYEQGIRIPKDTHKVALAKYFKTSVESIFFDT